MRIEEWLTTISEITGKPMLCYLKESCGESACNECCDTYGEKLCDGCPVQEGITRLHQYESTYLSPEEIESLQAQLAESRRREKISTEALRLAISNHSTDERQIKRLMRHYRREAGGDAHER